MKVPMEASQKLRVTTWCATEYRCDGYETNLKETQLHPQTHCSSLNNTRKWKSLKSLSADECVKEMQYIHRRSHHLISRISKHASLTCNEVHSATSHKVSETTGDTAWPQRSSWKEWVGTIKTEGTPFPRRCALWDEENFSGELWHH